MPSSHDRLEDSKHKKHNNINIAQLIQLPVIIDSVLLLLGLCLLHRLSAPSNVLCQQSLSHKPQVNSTFPKKKLKKMSTIIHRFLSIAPHPTDYDTPWRRCTASTGRISPWEARCLQQQCGVCSRSGCTSGGIGAPQAGTLAPDRHQPFSILTKIRNKI